MAGKKKAATALTELEIGVAKTLLGRKSFNNQRVLAAINAKRAKEGKPSINGGRISQIKNEHPSYANVPKSSDQDADDFLEIANSNSVQAINSNFSPINEVALKQLLLYPVSTSWTVSA